MNNPYAIYKFEFECRSGELSGIFLAEKAAIADLIGKEVYFGEVLGKHSEVSLTITEDEITMVTDDLKAINVFTDFNLECGYNPLSYFEYFNSDE